jgi:hypothetical protein
MVCKKYYQSMHETDINESLSKQWKREVRLGRGLDQSITIAPIIEPISNVPAVIAKRSQPGSVADDIAADELVALAAVGVVPFEVVEAPVLWMATRVSFKIGNTLERY